LFPDLKAFSASLSKLRFRLQLGITLLLTAIFVLPDWQFYLRAISFSGTGA
jgi:hypothetical protein